MPAARRELARSWWLGAAVVLAAAGAVAVVGWAAAAPPLGLRAVTVGVVVVWAVLAWRARPAYGRRRSLPPGSDWAYAKLYASPSACDRILADLAAPLLIDAERRVRSRA